MKRKYEVKNHKKGRSAREERKLVLDKVDKIPGVPPAAGDSGRCATQRTMKSGKENGTMRSPLTTSPSGLPSPHQPSGVLQIFPLVMGALKMESSRASKHRGMQTYKCQWREDMM